MHMADALTSPVVGGTLWAATAGTIAWCSRKVRHELDERKVPLMGVLGAFVFAAQMINFAIPGTGSSGHLGGGLLLAVLLGPYAAFIVISSVLFAQALFFADGGLLALGCNIFNLGFFPAFVAYPLIYRAIAPAGSSQGRITAASVAAAVAGLQFGAFAVVLETVFSGVAALPFSSFILLMQPIHLAIGIVEGFATAAVIGFVAKAHPDIVDTPVAPLGGASGAGFRRLILSLLTVAVFAGGCLSWFASGKPDGLEWAIAGVTGTEELLAPKGGIHGKLAEIQEKIALFPDYSFGRSDAQSPAPHGETAATKTAIPPAGDDRIGSSVAGIAGGALTLVIALGIGTVLRRRQSP